MSVALTDAVHAAAAATELDAFGITHAEPFERERQVLADRKAAGLHGGMHFTYGRPERSANPGRLVDGATALFAGARSYLRQGHPEVDHRRDDAGAVARYAWADHYGPLRDALESVADVVRDAGWDAIVLVDDNRAIDRAVAHRAGLGWFGKNANLLIPGAGSWFALGGVVTNAPIEIDPAPQPVADGCGPCRRCIDGCPTGAIVAPGVVDGRRCLAWLVQADGVFLREFRVALGDRLYGCDECQEVCPLNRRWSPESDAPPATDAADDARLVDLLDLLESGDETLMARHGRWYIPRRQPAYLRRNALVVLGNVGTGASSRVARVLATLLAHDDPMLRAHATWTARRLGRDDLVDEAGPDVDPDVAEERRLPVPLLDAVG